MKLFVESPVVATRNSLITIGSVLRTASVAVTDWLPAPWLLQVALPVRSPLNDFAPAVTLKVALVLAPGAIGPNFCESVSLPTSLDFQPGGTESCSLTLFSVDEEVFVNVSVDCCEEPGVNVCNPTGCTVSVAGVSDNCCTLYWAATIFACTAASVASLGKPGGHHTLVEGALRTIAVVAAVAQHDPALLPHRGIRLVHALPAEHRR